MCHMQKHKETLQCNPSLYQKTSSHTQRYKSLVNNRYSWWSNLYEKCVKNDFCLFLIQMFWLHMVFTKICNLPYFHNDVHHSIFELHQKPSYNTNEMYSVDAYDVKIDWWVHSCVTNQRDLLIRMRNERKFLICVYSLKVKMYVIVILQFHLHICRTVIDEI